MVSRKAAYISLMLLTCSLEAASNLCSLTKVNAEKVIKIEGIPGFFFKVHPDGKLISFIETGHNTLVDLNSGKELPTFGSVDPVWSPDGKMLTHPGMEETDGIQFLPGDKAIEATNKGDLNSLKAANFELKGVYQSIGANADGSYKIVSDHEGASIAEYNYSAAEGPKITSPIKKACSNIEEFPTDLPMLSKDGKYISVYDATSKTTKIFKFQGQNCELALDLGFPTAKVSFNNDSSQIAFHIDQFGEFQSGYFSGVAKDKVKNVVVVNLKETSGGKLEPVSWAQASHITNPGSGGYYPDYDKAGNVYFLEDHDNHFQFVKVAQKNLEFRPMSNGLRFGQKDCLNCQGQAPRAVTGTDILAKMWADACSSEDKAPIMEHREFVMGIDPTECAAMVRKFYVSSLGVSKDELLKICPQKKPTAPVTIGKWDPNSKADAETLIQSKCVICHTQTREIEADMDFYVITGPQGSMTVEQKKVKRMLPVIDLENIDVRLAGQMIQSIATKKMPKGGSLTDKQAKLISTYLERKTMDAAEEDNSNDYNVIYRYPEATLQAELEKMIRPEHSAEFKLIQKHTVYCTRGQQLCNEFIADMMVGIRIKAASLPEAQREGYLQDEVLALRCMNLFEVTPQQCIDLDNKERIKVE